MGLFLVPPAHCRTAAAFTRQGRGGFAEVPEATWSLSGDPAVGNPWLWCSSSSSALLCECFSGIKLPQRCRQCSFTTILPPNALLLHLLPELRISRKKANEMKRLLEENSAWGAAVLLHAADVLLTQPLIYSCRSCGKSHATRTGFLQGTEERRALRKWGSGRWPCWRLRQSTVRPQVALFWKQPSRSNQQSYFFIIGKT